MMISYYTNNNTYEIIFWDVILGVLIDEPIMLLPDITIPNPAPIIDNVSDNAIPKYAHEFGSIQSNIEPQPS